MGKENFRDTLVEFKEREPKQSTEIWYAGASPRRTDFLKHTFGEIRSKPGGDEANIEDVVSIMNRKLDNVLPNIFDTSPRSEKIGKNQKIAVVAADIRTRISRLDENGTNFMESRGKPESLLHIRSTFEDMYNAYEMTGVDPNYLVTVGSGIHLLERKKEERFIHYGTHTMVLDPEMTDYLSSDEGQVEYISTFYDLYDNLSANSNSKKFACELTDIAAGVELPVLTRMGAIKEIDGASVYDPNFDNVFRSAVYNVTVGISPDLLKTIKPDVDIDRSIQTWPFLNEITAFSLQNRAAA